MTPPAEDEAFIRAVVSAPGDDAPRLVYADWLDERGDPRGDYIRRELEAYRGEGFLSAKWLGGVLDALVGHRLWLQRVTRTPIGVCCDHVRFDCHGLPTGPPITEADLRAFEAQHQIVLPRSYWAFLLNYNGGHPYPDRFRVPGAAAGELTYFEGFFALEPAGQKLPVGSGLHPVAAHRPGLEAHGEPVLLIGWDGSDGALFITTGRAAEGRVYWHDDWTHEPWDVDRLREAATSLGAFLAGLTTADPEWVQAIIREEPETLRRCLDAGVDVNWTDPENGYSLLDTAVAYGRVGIARELLGRGAAVSRETRDTAAQSGNPELAALFAAPRRAGGRDR